MCKGKRKWYTVGVAGLQVIKDNNLYVTISSRFCNFQIFLTGPHGVKHTHAHTNKNITLFNNEVYFKIWGQNSVHSCKQIINSLALQQFLWLLEVPRVLEHPENNTVVYNTHTLLVVMHMPKCHNTC